MLEIETELWGQVQPKKLKLTWLDEPQRAAQAAQLRALPGPKLCPEAAQGRPQLEEMP